MPVSTESPKIIQGPKPKPQNSAANNVGTVVEANFDGAPSVLELAGMLDGDSSPINNTGAANSSNSNNVSEQIALFQNLNSGIHTVASNAQSSNKINLAEKLAEDLKARSEELQNQAKAAAAETAELDADQDKVKKEDTTEVDKDAADNLTSETEDTNDAAEATDDAEVGSATRTPPTPASASGVSQEEFNEVIGTLLINLEFGDFPVSKLKAKKFTGDERPATAVILEEIKGFNAALVEQGESLKKDTSLLKKQFAKLSPYTQNLIKEKQKKNESILEAIKKQQVESVCIAHLENGTRAQVASVLKELLAEEGVREHITDNDGDSSTYGVNARAQKFENFGVNLLGIGKQFEADGNRETLKNSLRTLITHESLELNTRDVARIQSAIGQVDQAGGGEGFLAGLGSIGDIMDKIANNPSKMVLAATAASNFVAKIMAKLPILKAFAPMVLATGDLLGKLLPALNAMKE